MPIEIRSDIEGMDELQRLLGQLPASVRRNAIRKASRVAMRPVRKEVRRQTPRGKTGNLRKSVTLKGWKSRRKQGYVVKVGFDFSKLRQASGSRRLSAQQRGYYGLFLERGTDEHDIVPRRTPGGPRRALNVNGEFWGSVSHPGQPARRYIERTHRSAASQTLRSFAAALPEEIEKEVIRLRARRARRAARGGS